MIYLSTLVLFIGILFANTFTVSLLIHGIISVFVCIIFLILFPYKGSVRPGILLAFLFFLSGMIFHTNQRKVPETFYDTRIVEGIVTSVNTSLDSTKIIVKDKNYKRKIQVTTTNKTIYPGDYVHISGTVQKPKDFLTSTNRIFQYESFLESKKIYGTLRAKEIIVVSENKFYPFRLALLTKEKISILFANYISFPIDGIVSGMIIGSQSSIPVSTKTLFQQTGVLHVLVLSGSNITLFISVLSILCTRFPKRMKAATLSLSVMAIVIISGAGIAAIRAGLMGIASIILPLFKRKYNQFRTLLYILVFFIIFSPYTVLYDPGFHLSFLATLFVCTIFPKILPRILTLFSFIPDFKIISFREIISLSIALPLFMLPYTMYFSGTMPLATIPANIFLALTTPIVLALAALLLPLSLFPPLATLIGIFITVIGTSIISALEALSVLPVWQMPEISPALMLLIYFASIFFLFKKEVRLYELLLRNSLLRASN
jgi:competence protein ComEC